MISPSAEGYIECEQGHVHWGRAGAAGLLLSHQSASGRKFLLQHRAPAVHQGDCWGIPGGALNWSETVAEAATREAREEMSVMPQLKRTVATYVADHGGWAYTTVHQEATAELAIEGVNWETGDLGFRWFTVDELATANLHPGFELLVREVLLLTFA